MKLNNLSRLTALLLALTMFLSSVAWADPVAEGDYTADNYAEMLAAQTGTCATCVNEMTNGDFPTTDHKGNTISITCSYEYLKGLGSPMERYNFLDYVYNTLLDSTGFAALYTTHEQHVEDGAASLLCTCPDRANTDLRVPGPENHAETCPWVDDTVVIIPNIPQPDPVNPDLFEQYTSNEEYDLPMAGDRAIILPEGGRAVIKSNKAAGYQWQVYDGTQWVGIAGETGADLVVTTAKLATIFDLTSIAEIRYFDAANDIVMASVSVVSQEIAGGEYVEPVEEEAAPTLYLVERDGETATHTILIEYKYADGKQAANPWSAIVADGSDYEGDVISPTVLGYTPDQETVSIDLTNITENKTYTVTYNAALVNYTVKHMQQNVADDDYTIALEETKEGYTASPVGNDLAKDYDGYRALVYDDTMQIAADGSTTVVIYYDREYHLMTFDLAGGYNVEPVYARFGTPIDTTVQPTRAGYTFAGWVDANGNATSISATMPDHDVSYKATWTPLETSYTVIYWQENANDSNYSYVENKVVKVNSGTVVSGSGDKTYTGFHFDHADTNVTVEGDGSTIVNVYYKRNTYTLTFAYEYEYTCGFEVHSHSYDRRTGNWYSGYTYYGGCYPETGAAEGKEICGLEEHSHQNSCREQAELICTQNHNHSVRNGCYGMKFEGIKYGQATDSYWAQAPSYKWLVTYGGSTFYTNAPAMPNGNLTIYGTSQSGSSVIHYYEKVNGQETTTKVHPDYTVNTERWTFTSEDYIEIPGFTYSSSKKNNAGTEYFIYYTRNSYTITFNNRGDTTTTSPYLYQADISGAYYVPTYTGDNADIYVFDGWYTTEDCLEGTKFEFTNAKMPYNNLILYAKWVPVGRTVTFYLTLEQLNASNPLSSTHPAQTVPHGTFLKEGTYDEPDRGDWEFIGWFYREVENGVSVEKAIDFKNMPITDNLNVYGKWSSNVMVDYTIYYEDQAGNTIADPKTGRALAGTSQTFEAKIEDDLYDLSPDGENYQVGYFPQTSSHSLEFSLDDPTQNVFTFVYTPKEEVPYVVKFLEKGTNTVLREQKNLKTRAAVVTEKFEYVDGYMPDAYQKRLVLSADETKNEIIFWYEVDTVHAPVQVYHYLQDVEGNGYSTVYREIFDMNAKIGDPYTTPILTIKGYTYDHASVDGNATTPIDNNTQVTATVDENGMLIEIYYNRNMYPFEFKFLEQGTNKVLLNKEQLTEGVDYGTARYQAQVTDTYKQIPGYELVSTENQKINIQIEDGNTAEKNVQYFYYAELKATINYVAVGPEGLDENKVPKDTVAGDVSVATEPDIKVLNGTVTGSTATASSNVYKFVGWYTNPECTDAVPADWVTTDADGGVMIVPKKTKDYDNSDTVLLGYESTTYYAKFEYNLTSMSIKKTGMSAGESAIFTVTNEEYSSDTWTVVVANDATVTLYGLTVGANYIIAEDGNWSWRYDATENLPTSIEIKANANENKVEITNVKDNDQWLSDESSIVNFDGTNQ